MSEPSYKKGGLDMNKYLIQKRTHYEESAGRLIPAYNDYDPDAEYFVLRVDKDPHAKVAVLAYADSVERDNPEFAKDIRDKWRKQNDTKRML